jgi:hypothetical protein
LSGEFCIREVAAYILDHKRFSGVPPTTFVEAVHNTLKFVPFSGMEKSSQERFHMLSALIIPERENLNGVCERNITSPDSMASTSKGESSHQKMNDVNLDTVTSRIAQD